MTLMWFKDNLKVSFLYHSDPRETYEAAHSVTVAFLERYTEKLRAQPITLDDSTNPPLSTKIGPFYSDCIMEVRSSIIIKCIHSA